MIDPIAIALAGVGTSPMLMATDGFIGSIAPVVRQRDGDGWKKHDYYHIETLQKQESSNDSRAELEDIYDAVDEITTSPAKPTADYEKIILANKQMADDILLLEYNILCKIERARIINDYSMVLLLLGD